MRRSILILALTLVTLVSSVLDAAAEETRTLRVELSRDAGSRFAVENLVGAMRVVPGSGETVVAVATVHAESAELAGRMRFEEVRGEGGLPTLRVRYPLDRETTFRHPRGGGGTSFLGVLGGLGNTTRYDGERVTVSSSRGARLHADVEVQVPRRAVEATFRNLVGSLAGEDLEGKLRFEAASGDLVLARLKGEVEGRTGSGEVRIADAEGDVRCRTGSGNCVVEGQRGGAVACETGSGDVHVRSSGAGRIAADTGSGDIRVEADGAEHIDADTGSGDVTLTARDGRLAAVKVDTGSGDVTLRLGSEASFEARADQGSGEIVNRYPEAQPILRRKTVVGYRRGEARTRIDVDTGSGDLTLEP